MQTPPPISYATFLAAAEPADVDAIVAIAGGAVVATNNETEFASYAAMGDRLWNAGLLRRLNHGKEDRDGETWYAVSGIVHPAAVNYVAQACKGKLSEA